MPEKQTETLEWLPPTNGEYDNGAAVHIWRTACGRYRVCRIAGPEPRFMAAMKSLQGNVGEVIIANGMRSLRQAFVSVEARHKDVCGHAVESNMEAVHVAAERNGLDVRPESDYADPESKTRLAELRRRKKEEAMADEVTEKVETQVAPKAEPESESKIMLVKETDARKMLKALGYGGALTVPRRKLEAKLNRLLKVKSQLKEPPGKPEQELRDKCLAWLESGKRIGLEDSKPEGNGKAKAGKAPKVEKKTGKKTKPEENGKVDDFGSRLGTDAAKVNSILDRSPKKMSEIVKEAKVAGTFYNHLNGLAKQGLVKKTKEGYALK